MPGMMDAAPMLPPDVSSQMGGQSQNSLSAIGKMMGGGGSQQQQQPSAPGDNLKGVNPEGSLPAMVNAMEKVAKHMARMFPKMQPFVERAMDLLKKGQEQSMAGGGQGANQQEVASPSAGEGAALPDNESNMSFPG